VHLTISISHFLAWLYSWLESKVEAKYTILKALPFAYVMHPDQVEILGNANCERNNIIREHVVPYE